MQHHLCKWYCKINIVVLVSVPNARFKFLGSVVHGIKFSRDHLFVAKNRKSKTKQNTRKQISFWLTKNWCSGQKINVAETGPVHGMGVSAGFRLQSPPLKSRDHSLCTCNCNAWGNTNTGSLSFRFFLTLFLLLDFLVFVLFCFFIAILFLFPAKNIELYIWQWFLTNRTLLHSQSWVNLPFCFLYDRKNKREREREKTKRMDFSTEAKETRGPGSPSKPVRRFLSYLWREDTMYYLWLVWAWYYSV